MRRTVATLLVIASPLLVAVPVGAADGPAPGRAAAPVNVVPAAPVAPAPPAVTTPALPAALPAADVERATAPPAVPVRPVARTLRPATHRAADLDDAAYAARLQAELCLARTIFCGLDRNGRYPVH